MLYKLPFFSFLLLLLACTSQKEIPQIEARKVSEERIKIKQAALENLGVPYQYGGLNQKEGFDCSGLVKTVFSQVGIHLPHSSQKQHQEGKEIRIEDAQMGDLVFFKHKSKIDHVAIIVEKQKNELFIVHSTSSKGVILEDLTKSAYWQAKLVNIKRLLGPLPN